MPVYKIVKTEGSTLGGRTPLVIVDCEQASIAELIAALQRGLVVCDVLWCRPLGNHAYSVFLRQPAAIRMDEVRRIEVPRAEYIEDVGGTGGDGRPQVAT